MRVIFTIVGVIPEPVVSLDFIKWPCKVYLNGSIVRMTKKEFLEIM